MFMRQCIAVVAAYEDPVTQVGNDWETMHG